MVKVRNWCALASTRSRSGAAQTKPTFQPVSEKILPAEPILTVRSRMPGIAISGLMAAAVEHHVLPDLVADGDRVVRYAEVGEQREILAAEDRARRVERVVEQHDACVFGVKAARQHRLGRSASAAAPG